MPRLLRAIVMWLLLFSLPLQGFAAASLAFCSPAKPMAPAAKQPHAANALQASGEVRHNGASAGHSHLDHGKHALDHGKCSVCASCCSGAAPASSVDLVSAPPMPRSEPFCKIQQDLTLAASERLERPPRLNLA